MKLVSFAVPCYNSEAYMRKCIDSLLTGGEDVEIIIVDDGSTDGTGKIADEYAEKYPTVVRAVHKENGGHGSGVNRGLSESTGLYYKVVDSDDWLDTEALQALLGVMRKHVEAGVSPDLYIANFVYEHAADNTRYVSRYVKKLPPGKLCGWKSVKAFHYAHMLLMHALFYKRERLLESGTVLPEHTFYVDNLFAYRPLPHCKTLFYLDADLYRYYIGRSGQSVNFDNFIKRYEQQIRVFLAMCGAFSYREICAMPKGLRRYMLHALSAILMNTLLFTCAKVSKARRAALREMWRRVREEDPKLYRKLKYRSYAASVNFLPWRMRGRIMTFGYKYLCKRIKLG